MPVVPTSYKNPTGKNNMLISFNKWLETNVPAGSTFSYYFGSDFKTMKFPSVHAQENPYNSLGNTAMGMVLFEAGAQTEGIDNQVIININIYDDTKRNASAKKNVLQIRDRIVYALRNAGHTKDSDDTELVPPINVLDYDNAAAATGTCAVVPINEDNWIVEQPFPPTAEQTTIHRHQLLVRLKWYELN